MQVPEQFANAVQSKIQKNVHDQGEIAKKYNRIRGSIAVC